LLKNMGAVEFIIFCSNSLLRIRLPMTGLNVGEAVKLIRL
jgi:hypothetical protein